VTDKQHSKLPWAHKTDGYLRNAEGRAIADFHYKNRGADLPFVCRAANNHESLLAALKIVQRGMKTEEAKSQNIFNPCVEEIVDAAIAKATATEGA
jgi:hypothetical protein